MTKNLENAVLGVDILRFSYLDHLKRIIDSCTENRQLKGIDEYFDQLFRVYKFKSNELAKICNLNWIEKIYYKYSMLPKKYKTFMSAYLKIRTNV